MKRALVFACLAIGVCCFVSTLAIAQDQADTTAAAPDWAGIERDLAERGFWAAFLVTMLFGAIGGVVFELLDLNGNIELPHRRTPEEKPEQFPNAAISTFMVDLGIFARLIIGALAAAVAVWVLKPVTGFDALAAAVVAGSAGTSIFKALQKRLLAALAEKDALNTRSRADAGAAKLADAQEAYRLVKDMVLSGSTAGSEGGTVTIQQDKTLDRMDLDRVGALLSEVKGMLETV